MVINKTEKDFTSVNPTSIFDETVLLAEVWGGGVAGKFWIYKDHEIELIKKKKWEMLNCRVDAFFASLTFYHNNYWSQRHDYSARDY